MSEENEDLAKLLAIVNQEVDEDEEQLTEEEIQQALSSPSLHPQIMDCGDEDSTECDDYEMSAETNDNFNPNDDNSDQESHQKSLSLAVETDGGQQPKPKSGEYQFQMLEHHIFKGKHGKKLYKCDVCYAVYRHSFSLKRHFIRSHINYGYLCETDVTNCGINLSASASLQTWKQQIEVQPLDTSITLLPELYCCHSCVLFYDDLPQIKGHVDDCHRNNKSGTIEPIRIPCSQCNMSFIQRHNLMRHIEVVHCGKRLYGCKHCAKKFQTIADRKKHEKSQHPSTEEPEEQLSPLPTSTQTVTKKSTGNHKCLKCSEILSTYSELRKHVTKKHKEFYNPCGYCNKFCFSKKQLSAHLRQKHEKTAKENTEKLKTKKKVPIRDDNSDQRTERTAITTQTLSQQNQFQAYFHCSLCYRRFLTYGSLIRHKQIAHRPQHVRKCSRLRADIHTDNEIVESYNSVQEFDFYRHLAQKVAENLLYFVDGKYVNPSNDYKVIPNPTQKKSTTNPDINFQKYNFPTDYQSISSPFPPTTGTGKLEFLFDCNLNKVKNPKFEPIIESKTDSMPSAQESQPKPQFICTACHQMISSELFAEHEANNHPNVYCTYIEVETYGSIPSKLLLWQYHCSEGLLRKCPTAPTLATMQDKSHLSLKCTKCQNSFASVNLLHNHILECAHNQSSKQKISLINCNKSVDSLDIQTSATANTSTTSTATIVNTSNNTSQSSVSNSLIESNTSVSSNATEFSSPLSPCKTRSGRRRQISPEDYVKTKRTRNSSKTSSSESKQTENHIIKEESDIKSKCFEENNKISKKGNDLNESNSGKESSELTANESPKKEESVQMSSTEGLPKRYSCKKCSKKFVYMDSLSKHQMSCKRVFQSNVNNKRKLRNSKQKVAKNIELKSIQKNIHKNDEKKNKISENSLKSIDNDDNVVTDEETEEEEVVESVEEVDEELESSDGTQSESTSLTPNADKLKPKQNNEKSGGSANDSPAPGEHRCPDCLRVFTYVANFRKHITNVCPVRKQLSNDSTDSESTPTPVGKSTKHTTEVIAIKQEKTESDREDTEDTIDDEEVVFDGQTKIEPIGDEEEGISIKDESKLDLWRVKQENPQFAFKGSPAQHHSCPYCQRGFTYLANYRKHIKSICPIRQQIDEKKKQVIEDNDEQEMNGSKVKTEQSLPTLAYTPSSLSVRSQIEDTVLTLLRDQTKQDQILQSSEDLIKSKSTPKSDDSSAQQSVNSGDNEANKSTETESNDSETKYNVTKESTQTSSAGGKGSSFRFRTFSCNICHKIFLSYVAMLKHRLTHKLTAQLPENTENNNTSNANESAFKTPNNELIEENGEKEAANQALAVSLLKRSKDVIFSKMLINAANNSVAKTKAIDSKTTIIKPLINTTELLEKLARGGINTDSGIQSHISTDAKSSTKSQEVIKIETNNNDNSLDLHLSASTSSNSKNSNINTNNNNTNNNNLEEIIIDENNINDLELNVLKDGVIVTQDLQQLIAVNDMDGEDSSKCGANEVLLNLDDIENANEVWITITDSNAFVEVNNTTTK